MLTIGELAGAVGVTTRTVRFYHQRGLLPEPVRDAAGYRRYGADDVVRLSRIAALAAAGVPLARTAELLDADDATFAAALDRIDAGVQAEIRRLRAVRASLATLRSADRLALPPVLSESIAFLRGTDAPTRYVDLWRDGSILLYALYPEQMLDWTTSSGGYGNPEYREFVARTLALADADPDDPRVAELARDSVEYAAAHPDSLATQLRFDDERANRLIAAQWPTTPAWERLSALMTSGLRERGLPPADDAPAADRGP